MLDFLRNRPRINAATSTTNHSTKIIPIPKLAPSTAQELHDRLAAPGFAVDIRTIQRNLNDFSRYYPIL